MATEGMLVVRVYVRSRPPTAELPAPADLHDYVRFMLEGGEIDSDMTLTHEDIIDPSSVQVTKVELTRWTPTDAAGLELDDYRELGRQVADYLGLPWETSPDDLARAMANQAPLPKDPIR